MTRCTPKQDQFLLNLWQRVTRQCCNGGGDPKEDLSSYYATCQHCYERVAKACLMAAHVYRRAKLPHHAAMTAKFSTLAQKKMRLADKYRRQEASLLSFGEAAVFHLDWHHCRLAAINQSLDELISQQGMIEAELCALLQVNQWTREQDYEYANEE